MQDGIAPSVDHHLAHARIVPAVVNLRQITNVIAQLRRCRLAPEIAVSDDAGRASILQIVLGVIENVIACDAFFFRRIRGDIWIPTRFP